MTLRPMRNALLFLVLLTAGSPVFGAMTFTSPGCGQSILGTVSIAATETSTAAARVSFTMGSHLLGYSPAPPFSVTWNSAEAMDGVSAIQATSFDALGNFIDSAECVVTLNNQNVTLIVNSPDLTQTLSGTVNISLTGADPLAFPAVWTLNVDGEQRSIVWTDNTWQSPLTISFSLDTTQISNGSHELHISMNSRSGPNNPQWVNWRGMVNRVIHVNNGHAWMDLAPQIQNAYLEPGGTINVGCLQLFTDGTSQSCASVAYSSANPLVATVDSNGNVSAVGKGFTQIQLQAGAMTATSQVWVVATPGVPHFSGGGQLLTSYNPAASLFVISPFFLDADLLNGNSTLLTQVRQAGVNSLSFGLYVNPWDTGADYSDWQTNYDATVGQKISWAQTNGFHLLLTGDDIFRRIGGDAWYTLNWPSGAQAVQHAVSAMAASGVGIGIEGIDEASSIWGPRPSPTGLIGQASYLFNEVDCVNGSCTVDWSNNPVSSGWPFAMQGSTNALMNSSPGALFTAANSTAQSFQFQAPGAISGSFTAANSPALEYLWFAGNYCNNNTPCAPEVPNNALSQIRGWMTAVPNPVAMAFPPIATDPATVSGAWMGPGSISDYASNYFTSMKTRTTYPWSEGIQEMVSSMNQAFFSRQPFLMLNRPQLMLVSLAGASYTKGQSSSAIYLPGTDSLVEPGVSPAHVSALMMNAAALGGAGIRLYYFEPSTDAPSRIADPPGTALQTGSNPSNLQTASWQAMGYASNLLTRVLQPFLLAVAGSAPTYGRNITTSVRQSPEGKMLMIVNGNDWPRTITVPFNSYAASFGTARYCLQATGISVASLPASQATDTLTLAGGETVVYIFPNIAAAMPLGNVTLTPLPSDGPIAGVQYAYIYNSEMDQAPVVSCQTSCTIARDPRLGNLYYRFILPGNAGKTAIRTSPPLKPN